MMVLLSLPCLVTATALAQKAVSPSAQEELFKTLNGLAFILILLFFLALLFLAFLGIEIFLLSTSPNFISSTKNAFSKHHRRSFLWGLVGFVLALIVVILLGQLGDIGGLLALIIITLVIICMLFGLGGISSSIGEKVLSLASRKNSSPITALSAGLFVLGLGIILPGIGWFIFLPYLMAVSLGTFLQAKFAGRRGKKVPEILD